jgi:hypothetical protein
MLTHPTLRLDDDAFLDAVHRCALPDGFPHVAHLRLAFLALRRHPLPEAMAALELALRGVAAHAGTPERYQPGVTCHWTQRVAAAVLDVPDAAFDELLAGHPELLR